MFVFKLSLTRYLILIILSRIKLRTANACANKLTGNMELVLLRDECISFFSRGTFQRYVFMLSTRFVQSSENVLSHKTWSHFVFPQYLEAYLLLGL